MKTGCLTRVLEFIAMAAFVSSASTQASEPSSLGQFENHSDIGSPALAGAAQYDPVRQTYTVSGAGVNMWNKRDEFHFVWKRLEGDFILQTRVAFTGKGAEAHRKIGWMARPSLDADSMCVDAATHGNGLTSLQFRLSRGTNTQQQVLNVTNADVLQLERRGDTYIFSAARFGAPFVSSEISDLAMGKDLYVGLFVCSHNAKVAEQAAFQDVRIIRPAKEGFVPYHDYIGSYLELLDLASGDRQLIFESSKPFEAPNWTPDGRYLIYNSSGSSEPYRGHLYRFNLELKQPALINTDFATRNNNDHVLSFDGTLLGISHQDPSHHGQSAVYTLPVNGGTPRLITPLTPSYLHGWSPDARYLVYTGGRNGEYNIYKIPSAGGDEVQLTRGSGLNDGPEFTPDGKYIYFNSTRTGLMQLWRMRPDGSEQEQITHDLYNNWFPHISPDGQWIAFISYSKDIKATDHPYYKHVYLRLMPIGGGQPKVIGYVYGGQGTMNVPSWSPDGKRLAFVSNSDLQ